MRGIGGVMILKMKGKIKIAREVSGRIMVTFSYDQTSVAKIKTIEGRRWHPKEKYWSVPYSEGIIERLLSLFGEDGVELDPGIRSNSKNLKDVQASGNQENLRRADEELSLRGYSPKTRKVYRGHIERFLHFYRKGPLGLEEGEVRQYLLHLLEEKSASHSYVNQALSALKFLYVDVLGRSDRNMEISPPK